MKKNYTFFLIVIFLLCCGSSISNAQIKESTIGKWSFQAPTAPEGYTWGIITLKKDSSFMQFTSGNYKYPSNWLKAKNDSIIYESYIDGTTVLFSLKINDASKVTGKAVWVDGETDMILTKKED